MTNYSESLVADWTAFYLEKSTEEFDALATEHGFTGTREQIARSLAILTLELTDKANREAAR